MMIVWRKKFVAKQMAKLGNVLIQTKYFNYKLI